MKVLLTVAILVTLAGDAFAANQLYDGVNRLRSGEGKCAAAESGAEKPQPLAPQPALEQAARALAGGKSLQDGLKDAGYRATRSVLIKLVGTGAPERILAKLGQDFCAQLTAAAYSDVGIHQDAHQVWIVMAAPFAPRVEDSGGTVAQKLLALVNQARGEARVCGDKPFKAARPLRWNDVLAKASAAHAEDMARHSFLEHRGRDGSTPPERVARAGYRYRSTGENIAGGPTTAEGAVAGWIKSPPHCANLMNPAFTEMGAAFAVNTASELGVYWAQVFGTPR